MYVSTVVYSAGIVWLSVRITSVNHASVWSIKNSAIGIVAMDDYTIITPHNNGLHVQIWKCQLDNRLFTNVILYTFIAKEE